jgi:hypothetical protein
MDQKDRRDWSSDVCSSDLPGKIAGGVFGVRILRME